MRFSFTVVLLLSFFCTEGVFAQSEPYSDFCGPSDPREKKDKLVKRFGAVDFIRAGGTSSFEASPFSSGSFDGGFSFKCRDCTPVKDNQLKNFPGIVSITSYKFRQSPVDPDSEDFTSNGCGGTFVHDNYIVTAAHCLDKSSDMVTITYGTVDNADSKAGIAIANKAHCMKGYEIKNHGVDNDIALIDISSSVFDDLRKTLKEANIGDVASIEADNPNAIFDIAGWGTINTTLDEDGSPTFEVSTKLREGRMKLYKYTLSTIFVQPHIFNGATTSICSGDSGGPLYWTNDAGSRELVGVVSTEGTGGQFTCVEAYDGLFLNLASHKSWMQAFSKWN